MYSEQLIAIQGRLNAVAETLAPHDLLRNYLQAIGQVEPLTEKEERKLAQVLSVGRVAELHLNETLDERDTEEMAVLQEQVAHRDQAKQRLVEANLHLVVSLASRHAGQEASLLDLIQEGNLALIRLADHFAQQEENALLRSDSRFQEYAIQWVRQALLRTTARNRQDPRIPVELVEEICKTLRISRNLVQELGHMPAPEVIAAKTGTTAEWVRELFLLAGEEEYQIAERKEESELELSLWERFEAKGLKRDEVEAELLNLLPREAQILRLRLGLEDGREHSREEMAEQQGVSVTRIRQIEAKGMRKVLYKKQGKPLRTIKEYLE